MSDAADRHTGGGSGGSGGLGSGGLGGSGGGSGGSGPRVKVTPGLVLWGLVALVGIVLMAQNTDQTRVRVFGFAVEMPLFLLIGVAMVIGWLLGALGWWLFRRRQNRG